jgi:hypothetical protein
MKFITHKKGRGKTNERNMTRIRNKERNTKKKHVGKRTKKKL